MQHYYILKAERRSTEKTAGLHSRPQKKHQWRRRVTPITTEQRPCPSIGLFATYQGSYGTTSGGLGSEGCQMVTDFFRIAKSGMYM